MTGTPESDRTRYGARSRRSARQQAVIQQLSTRPVSTSLASASLPAGSDPADAFLLRMQQRTARTLELADRLLERPAIHHLLGQTNVFGISLDTTARSILARAATLRRQRLRALDSEEHRAEPTAAWREASRRRV